MTTEWEHGNIENNQERDGLGPQPTNSGEPKKLSMAEGMREFAELQKTPEGRAELTRRITKSMEIYARTVRNEPPIHLRPQFRDHHPRRR